VGSDGAGWVGKGLARKEDNRLLRGRGKFIDDIRLHDMLYLKFVRSPYAHARVTSLDTAAAEALPGVICTLTGAEIANQTNPFIEIGPDPFARIKDYPLAVSKVRYQGEPVAAVIATSPQIADDAAELVQVDYESLEVVVDGEESLERLRPASRGGRNKSSLARHLRIRRHRESVSRSGSHRAYRQDAFSPLFQHASRK